MHKLRRVGLETGALTDEEMEYVDSVIVQTVYPLLIGRRIFPVHRLGDAGFTALKFYKETDMGAAMISMRGETGARDIAPLTAATILKVPVISKDFRVHWRDVIAARRNREPLDVAYIRNASRQVAEEEDKLLLSGEYSGWNALGIEGLLSATNRLTQASAGAWPANVIADVKAAVGQLLGQGYYGPYTIIMTPTHYGKLLDQLTNTERTYASFVENEILGAGGQILKSANLYVAADGGVDSAVVVQPGADNFDMAIGQDITSYLFQNEDMNIDGKVYEVLTPRIKRAASICEITGIT